jgi:hypothetical protein
MENCLRIREISLLALMAIDKTTFRPVAFDGLTISFAMTGNKITGLTMVQGTRPTAYNRVEESGKP